MLTGIITFVVIFAVVGSILYGRKLAKTEKLDAVFGNPERAKGGVHWVIVGSSFLLLTWLYYSWDMAKSFYPQSANELCQVAKVNESLRSLKYLFPIDERELKSTSIIKIEGKNFAGVGMKNEDVLKRLKGKVGSEVNITVLSPNNKVAKHKLLRGSIPLKSISASTIIKDNIGYIKLSSFSNSSDLEFKNAIIELKNQGMEKLIFDLRFNGGGYLHQAINISDEFLKEDQLIVYTEGAHSKKRSFYSRPKGLFEDGELIILVNSSTASASEIVSGAIQDNKRGKILGRRTFGKGLVQQPLMLPDSSELRITTSRYYTPSGKCIQKPYGENIDYENDIFERIESGELTQSDSVFDKSIFKGGILPDVYFPIDTLVYSKAINNIIYTRKWRDFCFSYFEKFPKSKSLNTKDYYINFKIENKELEKYLEQNGKKISSYNPKEISDLKWSLKIELSSYYLSDQSRYILNTFRDSDVKKAIEEMSN